MLCESCGGDEATIHTTDIINNMKSERHLCEPCYKKGGLALPFSQINFADPDSETPASKVDIKIIKQVIGRPPAPSSKQCHHCGITLDEFRKRGAIGCAQDYEVFGEEIEDLMVKLHGGRRHQGKFPKEIEARRAREHRVSQLESDLESAVAEERYEDAACLRDRISALGTTESVGGERQPEEESGS